MVIHSINHKKAMRAPFIILCLGVILSCILFCQPVNAATSSSDVTIRVTIIGEPPVATFIGDPISGTAPLGVTFTSSLSSGTLPVTYGWEYSTDSVSWTTFGEGAPNPSFTFSTAGTYSIRLTVTNIDGIISITRLNYITVYDQIIVPTATLPTGSVGTAYSSPTITTTGGSGAYTFSVPPGTLPPGLNLVSSGTTGFTISGTPTAAGTYPFTITATDTSGNGLSGTQTYSITVYDQITVPTATLPAGSVGTAYSSPTITASGGSGAYTFSVPPGTLPPGLNLVSSGTTGFAISGTPTATGTYSFTITATDTSGNGLSGTQTYSITVNEPPIAAFSSVTSGLTVQFTDQSTGTPPLTYAWNFGDGTTSAEQSPTHPYTAAGTYTVTLTVSNVAGTSVPATATITVAVPPVAAFASAPSGLTVQFTDQSTGTPPLTYAWNFGDGTTSAEQNPSHTYASAGTYTVTLTVTNSAGVSSTATATVSVAVPAAAAFASVITGLTVQFTDQSTGTPPLTCAWNFGDGTTSAEQNPSHTYASAGTYAVTLTVTNSAGIISTATRDVTVFVPPLAAFTSTPSGLTVRFTDQSLGTPPLTCSWDFGDGTSPSLEQNPTHTYATAGIYTVTLTVTNSAGATSTASATISLTEPLPVALPEGEVSTDYNQGISPPIDGTPPYTYSVTSGTLPPGLTLDTETGIISGIPTTEGIYSFTISVDDSNGRTGSQRYTITVKASSSSSGTTDSNMGGFDTGLIEGITGTGKELELNAPPEESVIASQTVGFAGITVTTSPTGERELDINKETNPDVEVKGDTITITQPGFTLEIVVGGKITDENGHITGTNVESILLTTSEIESNVTLVGNVYAFLQAYLNSLPEGAAINTSISMPGHPDVMKAFQEALKKEDKELDGWAYDYNIEKTNFDSCGPTNITMTVTSQWLLENGGIDNARIIRIADDGSTQVLPIINVTLDETTGDYIITAFSKDGCSIFGLVTAKATETEQAVNPNVTIAGVSKAAMSTNVGMFGWLLSTVMDNPVILVIVAAVILLVAYFGWWKRRL
jgi:PKD repeat protein